MQHLRKLYYRLFVTFMIILCMFCIFITIALVKNTQKVNAQETRDQIYEIKKTFLKDTVLNVMKDLDRLRSHYNETATLLDSECSADQRAKNDIAILIREKKFQYDAYIWVNEVIDYAGGEKYAIRRIHPNLRNTEGSYLSTESKDIKGNKPYLTELEGIKQDGEVFSTYWFKRMNSDEISEKLTYAALYKDFNWIIAMGIHLDDIQTYIDKADARSQSLTTRTLSLTLLMILVLFSIGIFLLSRLETWYYKRTHREIKEESNIDQLTGALNRRIGDAYLIEAFNRFKAEGSKVCLYFIDLDNFKPINDALGHEAGDVALKVAASRCRDQIRSEDQLFRWGGDEFLCIVKGIDQSNAAVLAEKMNRAISGGAIPLGEGKDQNLFISVSIGISCFLPSDKSYTDALGRSDAAMYEAKKSGGNCSCRIFETV
ncbi:MAG: diguanylate cyclase [Spirochaetia bacterium]|jgi:diguanylate cyclase (GGDEF)-like protein|nr:diguanylate cyclase [Spirochaetia bacterium]